MKDLTNITKTQVIDLSFCILNTGCCYDSNVVYSYFRLIFGGMIPRMENNGIAKLTLSKYGMDGIFLRVTLTEKSKLQLS